LDGGTAYFEPDDNFPLGGFKCLHGHCADRHVSDLLAYLNIEMDAARMQPVIRIVPGELHRVVDAAESELARTSRYYQRGGLIVGIFTDPGTREIKIHEINKSALVRALAAIARWERFDGRTQAWMRVDPPDRHAGVLLDSPDYPHLPVLNALARQPCLRPDGTVMSHAGYDQATAMFGAFDEADFDVPEHPTEADAQRALANLQELLREFSFAREEDRAAALSAILTAVIRPSLAAAPMVHVRAHMVGSGKSYLCQLISAFATPQRSSPMTFPSDDEECRKLLLAELLRGPAVIEFDNLTVDLVSHKSLCTALTSEYMSGRILGVSKTASFSTRCLFLSSGNNVGPIDDMTRRCITINLSPQCEIPAARSFQRPNLVADVLRSRGPYISAALTIIRAWIAAGRPITPCRAVASYQEWSNLCRQPLLWLGCADPAMSVFEAIIEDPDRQTLDRLLTAWQGVFGKSPAMVRDAVRQAHDHIDINTELKETLHEIAGERGEINRRKLGWWIKRHAGRIVDGRRFRPAPGRRSAEAWQVELVSLVSSVPKEPTPQTVTPAPRGGETSVATMLTEKG
jgi:hypothetical protein